MRLPRRHARPPRLEALLRDVDELRLTLDVDLTVAAAALEDDRPDVAADVIDHDRAELMNFAIRADRHLEAAAAAAAVISAPDESAPAPSQPQRRRRAVLSASQAVLAAAACAVVFAGVVPNADNQPTNAQAGTQIETSYAEFTHLARTHSDPRRIVAAGHKLNRSIEARLAAAANDPVRARQMLRILQEEQRLLMQMNSEGSATLLAQAQALLLRLAAALEEGAPPSTGQEPATTPDEPTAPTPVGAPTPAPAPETDDPTTAPSAAPSPTATPAGEPTTATIEPEPEPQPTTTYPFPFGVGGVDGDTH